MPFRDPQAKARTNFDPLERFFELEAAFESRRRFGGDRVPLRLAAANLVLAPSEAEPLVLTLEDFGARLGEGAAWYAQQSSSLNLLIAAVLLEHGDEPEPFIAEVGRVRELMREHRVRQHITYETLAILVLRTRGQLEPISAARVARFAAIYAAMKGQHRWLTGREDYPACAFFVDQPGAPEHHAKRANAVYQALRTRASLWFGDPLQTASNMLALSPLEPNELAERFAHLAAALHAAGAKVRMSEYDEVALLCFLARPTEHIVTTLIRYRDAIAERLPRMSKAYAFSLAANLACVRMLGDDDVLGPLADVKMLIDMQTIIAARAAAAAAAGAA